MEGVDPKFPQCIPFISAGNVTGVNYLENKRVRKVGCPDVVSDIKVLRDCLELRHTWELAIDREKCAGLKWLVQVVLEDW